jgi:hypothetical protein
VTLTDTENFMTSKAIATEKDGADSSAPICSTFLTEAECDRLEELFNAGASRTEEEDEHWVGGGDEGQSYCYKCCKKRVAELLKEEPDGDYHVDGGWGTESDSTPFCETCQTLLRASLTQYGCESEVEHFLENGFDPKCDMDCYSMERVISSGGWKPYHFENEPAYKTEKKEKYFTDLHALGRRILDALDKSNISSKQ